MSGIIYTQVPQDLIPEIIRLDQSGEEVLKCFSFLTEKRQH